MLLSDPRAEVLQRYGAWKQHSFGREGVLRRTYLIDPEGMVQKVYEQVTPKEHGAEIAHDVAELQAK
jgi:peroxiredoxin Q/BCP